MKFKTLLIGVIFILFLGTASASTLENSYISYKLLKNKSVLESGFFITEGSKGSLKNGSINSYSYVTCKIDNKITRKSFGGKQIFEGIYLVHSIVNEKLNIYLEIHKVISKDNEVKQISANDCANILPNTSIFSETLPPLGATKKPKKVHLRNGYVFEYIFIPKKL